jgi:serine protease inhibitor
VTSADPAAVSAVANAEQAFAAALLKQVSAGTRDNVSVSPASLAIALAMLRNGARGNTGTEIAAALQAGGLSPSAVDAGWAGLTAQWSAAAKSADIEFSSANSLWQQRGLALRPDFMATLARFYASGVWQVDFARDMPGALAAMNQWTSQHTHGRITKLFGSLDPATLLVLANAVYFHASWQSQFDPSESKPAPFVTADGAPLTATFMTTPAPVSAARTDTYDAAELPYQGGRFSAVAIMPTRGSLTDFVRGLDGSQLSRIASTLTTQLPVQLPRFTTTSTTDLGPVLQAMGMRTAFSDRADFSAMSPTPMQVGQAIQRVYLKVAEKGTEAAAVTGIGLVPTLAQPAPDGITFDHPFLFLIRDAKTGAVLFASTINRPDSAG